MSKAVLSAAFYAQPVVEVARQLLGRWLCVDNQGLCIGRIVETEAYAADDQACHAYGGRRTPRNRMMYATGGVAYVYVCYGMHILFNVVCEAAEVPAAVLIRGVEPLRGAEQMQLRRGHLAKRRLLTAGPGRLTQAMGITRDMDGVPLDGSGLGSSIWIEAGEPILDSDVHQTTRIGVESAGADARRPWRFYYKGNPFVSVL